MKRIVPILLLKDRLLYKTKNFKNPKYIGDPFIALKIFNEKEVDELFVLDIDKSNKKIGPDFKFLENLASEAFMPLAYGGGITTIEQAEKIFQLGFEKIAINTSMYADLDLIKMIASTFGSQAIVASIDYSIDFFGRRSCVFNSSKQKSDLNPKDFALACQKIGAGEILLQCVSYEGGMKKMDLDFIKEMVQLIQVPIIGSGGAPSHNYIKEFFDYTNASAIAAGSIFVYHGPHNAVLINYPSFEFKSKLIS